MGFATLGPITFEASADLVRTFRDAKRDGEARWHEHAVHLGKPLSEFQGPPADQISFTVRLDIDRGVVPRDELRQMRRARDQGEVLEFVIGGELVGDYTLRGVSENWTRLDASGVLTAAEVTITMKEYA
jgi:phage protein U